jgi:hypothetical protein
VRSGAGEPRRRDGGDTPVLALLPSTGVSELTQHIRLSTTAISLATIDRKNYAYYVSCRLGADIGVGIWGADVTYRISSANG